MSILRKLFGYPIEEKELTENYDGNETGDNQPKEARDRIIFEKLVDNSKAQDLAAKLVAGEPLVINFEDLGVNESNQLIAFLSGVIYATGGVNLQMTKKIFIFSKDENMENGSIMHFYNQYREEA